MPRTGCAGAPRSSTGAGGEQFDGLIARFTLDYLARHAALGSDDETPLLVLGMPRLGTTLTEQILSSHSAVVGGGELPFWLEA
jgi:hypothetical protein